MFISLATFFIYSPLLLAAFILSIILMSRGAVGTSVIFLLITLIIPTIIWFGLFAYLTSNVFAEANEEREQKEIAKINSIEFEEVEGFSENNYMRMKGKVRNTGTDDVEFVKVMVEWLDNDGRVIDTDYTYAVGGEGLKPQSAKSFEVMSQNDSRISSFRYYVGD